MIRLFVMDVDGTMTDGGILMDGRGNEWKRFDVKDGMGIARLKRSGVEVCIISGRPSNATAARAEELGIKRVYQGVGDKLALLKDVADEMGLSPQEIAYIGDDVNDVDCLKWVGLSFAPSDALVEAKEAADVVTPSRGGYGAVRDAAELILQKNKDEGTFV
ncbi:HAD family hydrolase [Thermovirga sp.]|uniref:KdsC family phosphatase n=1 Tax=Thermovirga sp. TaxID=2699834 RepID=UPI0025FB1806|nr:HAD-IIIA family hydrolase [Thermovirga sp.]MBO8154139.1 HAD-IIIA family hydrolase [Thermovirga sp.]